MNVIVLNGSPKGAMSVTMQYVNYVKKHLPQHEFVVVDISHDIKRIESDAARFDAIISQIRGSDGVVWAFPVYYLLVPSQYKRFIELVFERGAGEAFAGKHAAVLTTSIHYYDTVARDYMHAICDDLRMVYAGDFLCDMNDLERPEVRKNLITFAEGLVRGIETHAAARRLYDPVRYAPIAYRPAEVEARVRDGVRTIAIVTDEYDGASNLGKMIDVVKRSVSASVEVVDLSAIGLKGGCLGCLNCAYDNTCVYRDGLRETYERLCAADAVVLAGTIRDRHVSSRLKMFFDRSFYRGHIPFLSGKLAGALISGPLGQNATLRQWLEMFLESYTNSQAGIVTDEYETSEQITGCIQSFASELEWVLDTAYRKPETFYGKSSRLIFRDFVYLARGVFRADHKYYKASGLYDFPQKQIKMRANSLVLGSMFRIKSVRTQIQRDMKYHMIAGLERVVRDN